jgi:hypothetical protein
MSQFLLLIYEEEAPYETADQNLFNEVMAAHQAFGQKYADKLRGGEALKATKTARTVRGDAVTDGPFLETKEALGGYYVVEADSMDEAVEIAKQCPARFGCIEVREVMVFS